MSADELSPGTRLFPLRSRGQASTFENVAYRLIADVIAKCGQGTGQAVIAPAAIRLGHLYDQVFHVLLDAGTPPRLTLIGAIELLCDQLAMPAQNRVGLGSLRDFFSRLLAQFLANLGQGLALGVTQLDTSFDLVT